MKDDRDEPDAESTRVSPALARAPGSTRTVISLESGAVRAASDSLAEGRPDSLPWVRPDSTAKADLGSRYVLGSMLGRGGMGEIRLARDGKIDRDVAVKLMHPGQRDDDTVARFFREARIQGGLEHPAVVPVHDLGIDKDGNPFFVMKRLTGTTLYDVLAAERPVDDVPRPSFSSGPHQRLSRRELLSRFVDVCLAVEFAHTRGVVHRDLKPANIMFGDFGETYILDWGLARIVGQEDNFRDVSALSGDQAGRTVAGEVLGTPGYMSPEQANCEQVDERTDVFALGCVLFEILVGEPALPRGLSAIKRTLDTAFHRPSTRTSDGVAPELDDICARATAQHRDARPSSARELAASVQAYLDGDRDLARRRELAESYAQRAVVAITDSTDAHRSKGMREAGRALALDPDNQTAQLVLGRMLLDRPDEIPAGALETADLERNQIVQRVMRSASRGYLGMGALVPVLFVFKVHAIGLIVLLSLVLVSLGCTTHIASRKVLPSRTRWFGVIFALNCAMIGLTGIIFGPLFLVPMFVTGSMAAWLVQPLVYSPWLITAGHLVATAPILILEVVGVLPSTFTFESGRLILEPWALHVTPTAAVIIYLAAFITQTAASFNVMVGSKVSSATAQNQVHAQTWHLSQLLPRSNRRR